MGYLVGAGLLQTVHHGLKLQRFDLHLPVQSVEQRLILRVQVVVWLLQVQTQSCGATRTDTRHDYVLVQDLQQVEEYSRWMWISCLGTLTSPLYRRS